MKKSASYTVDPENQAILRLTDILDLSEDGRLEKAERQRLGRYRMFEAAEAIVRQDAKAPFRVHSAPQMGDDGWPKADAYDDLYDFDERAGNEVKALIASAQSGDLPVYLPGRTERHRVEVQVGIYHEEAYWDDLNAWMDRNEPRITFRFPAPDDLGEGSESDAVNKPLQRQRYQEQEILRVIAELGYEAKRLPRNEAGKKGPKSEVLSRLVPKVMTRAVFDLAWRRLRAAADVVDAV